MLEDLLFKDHMVEVSPICLHMGRRECSLVLYQHEASRSTSLYVHKPLVCSSGSRSARQDKRAAPLRVAAETEKTTAVSIAQSYACTSTSAPHSSGTCLETGNYTTGGGSAAPVKLSVVTYSDIVSPVPFLKDDQVIRVGFWQNGFFADFYFWAAGFSRRIFSPHFCGKKCPEKSSRKIPAKILQNLYNKNPPKFIQQKSSDTFLQNGRGKSY